MEPAKVAQGQPKAVCVDRDCSTGVGEYELARYSLIATVIDRSHVISCSDAAVDVSIVWR